MSPHPLFTVGHSNRSIEEFVAILRHSQVQAIADVRSHPFSRMYPQFNAAPLKAELRRAGVGYVFLGDALGARRIEAECYNEGCAKYELIANTAAFRGGLDRVRRGAASHCITLMCAEKDPITCHRMILVSRRLRNEFDISHILDDGVVEPNKRSEARLLEAVGLNHRDLFRSRDEVLMEAYDLQGSRIAYKESTSAPAEIESQSE